MVGGIGIEPMTPSMSRKCSPAELTAPPAGRGFYSVGVCGGQADLIFPPEPAPSLVPGGKTIQFQRSFVRLKSTVASVWLIAGTPFTSAGL